MENAVVGDIKNSKTGIPYGQALIETGDISDEAKNAVVYINR